MKRNLNFDYEYLESINFKVKVLVIIASDQIPYRSHQGQTGQTIKGLAFAASVAKAYVTAVYRLSVVL